MPSIATAWDVFAHELSPPDVFPGLRVASESMQDWMSTFGRAPYLPWQDILISQVGLPCHTLRLRQSVIPTVPARDTHFATSRGESSAPPLKSTLSTRARRRDGA